ncbi:MAG: hypothetical protein HY070_08040, partial [Chloroflexi bacterium]|nr:hypothetical protein [Chloroflexota bacterium]
MTFDARSFFPLRPGLVFLILGATIFILFGPIIPTYFVVDDYNFVGELMLRGREYVQGYELHRWFIEFSAQGLQIPELSIFFRPGVHGLWLIDYLFWGTWAPGYHVTNIFLHVLNSFLVYLLALQILRHRAGALVAGFLFALQPIHVTAVALASNRVDLLSAFFYLASALYFVLFRQRSKRAYAIISALLYAGAIGTKESTVALPLILVGYDLLFSFPELRAFTRFQIARVTRGKNFAAESNAPETFSAFRAARQIIVAQIPYALVLVIYVALRFLAFDEFGRNTGGGFLSYGAELFFQFYTLALSEPFVADMNNGLLFSILAAVAIMLAIFRARRAMWFGAGWIAVSLIPATLVANVAPRIAYTPSAGLPLALAAILVQPVARIGKFSRRVGIALVLFLFGAYTWGLSAQVD